MKPKDAKKLLGCSYTTLHNYVKDGKIRLSDLAGKQHDYDEKSVMELHDRLCAAQPRFLNKVKIFTASGVFEFDLDKKAVEKMLDALKADLVERIG